MSSTTYANTTAGMAAAARACSWRDRGFGHLGGGSQVMCASAPTHIAVPTAPNATKRSPRRLAERLT